MDSPLLNARGTLVPGTFDRVAPRQPTQDSYLRRPAFSIWAPRLKPSLGAWADPSEPFRANSRFRQNPAPTPPYLACSSTSPVPLVRCILSGGSRAEPPANWTLLTTNDSEQSRLYRWFDARPHQKIPPGETVLHLFPQPPAADQLAHLRDHPTTSVIYTGHYLYANLTVLVLLSHLQPAPLTR